MAICVYVGTTPTTSGHILVSTETVDQCTTYILQGASEYRSLLDNAASLNDIFTMPVAADLQQMWMLGFSTPVLAYLLAWGYQVIISMFKTH